MKSEARKMAPKRVTVSKQMDLELEGSETGMVNKEHTKVRDESRSDIWFDSCDLIMLC